MLSTRWQRYSTLHCQYRQAIMHWHILAETTFIFLGETHSKQPAGKFYGLQFLRNEWRQLVYCLMTNISGRPFYTLAATFILLGAGGLSKLTRFLGSTSA